MTAAALLSALSRDARTRVGRRLDDVRVRQRDAGGRADEISLAGDQPRVVRGEDFRAALNQSMGPLTLQSTRFTVTKVGRAYVFDGRGAGHGVGMCQVGAEARARRGDSVGDILDHYFPGASIARTGT